MASADRGRKVLAAAVLAALAGAALIAWATGVVEMLSDRDRLAALIESAGPWGLLAVAGAMAAAVVVAPLPSAPLAVAAGAAYGEVWGTVAVVAGAEAGSLIAFGLARRLGADLVRAWIPRGGVFDRLSEPRSQTWLMAIVFVSRLLPFLSFDAVSYAAGLSPLAFWRFAVATLLGVLPVAFLLAYAGADLLETGSTTGMVLIGLLAVTSAAPLLIGLVRRIFGRGTGPARP